MYDILYLVGLLGAVLFVGRHYTIYRDRKIDEDRKINYENEIIECDPPFERGGKQFFEIICNEYQLNKREHIENILCKTGNDILYREVKYYVLGCFEQKSKDKSKVIFHVMVEPDISNLKQPEVNYYMNNSFNNNVNGIMNGDFSVSFIDQEESQQLISELQEFSAITSDELLKKELEIFEYKLKLEEIGKEEASRFLQTLERYKNIPIYTSSVTAITNTILNLLDILK